MGCSLWGREELDMTERLHFDFSLSCIGEGNGNPFQCSCLENPRDGGAWWAADYGVAQRLTRLKRLSSSSHLRESEICLTLAAYFLRLETPGLPACCPLSCLSKNFFNIVQILGFKGMDKDKVIILTQIKM